MINFQDKKIKKIYNETQKLLKTKPTKEGEGIFLFSICKEKLNITSHAKITNQQRIFLIQQMAVVSKKLIEEIELSITPKKEMNMPKEPQEQKASYIG